MEEYIKIKIRRDTTANWESNNPVLALGEIAADMTKHLLKVGDGMTAWKNLPYFCSAPSDESPDNPSIEIVNDLKTGGADKALSAEQGKVLNDMLGKKVDSSSLENFNQEIIANVNSLIEKFKNEYETNVIKRITKIEEKIGNAEEWEFTLSDGSTVTKMVVLGDD